MADIKCNACEDLRVNSPEFSVKGVTDNVCTSLKNDTGFSTTNGHDTCTDLDLANDCLVGAMEKEVNSYQVCDWRKFAKKFIKNLHTVLKAIICAICGILKRLKKTECEINYLYNGAQFYIGEETSGNAYAVAGKGVSFLIPQGGDLHTSDLYLLYIAGGLLKGFGSFQFFDRDFTDKRACYSYDNNGVNPTNSQSRKGNSVWHEEGRMTSGGELICEFRIKKSAYPQLKRIYEGFGQESGGGGYHVRACVFDGDTTFEGHPTRYAWGQHGWCDEDGAPVSDGDSHGHAVPKGMIYVQLRLTYAFHHMVSEGKPDGQQYTPAYFMGVRMNQNSIGC